MSAASAASAPAPVPVATPTLVALQPGSGGFSDVERRLLLTTRGIGLGVIDRIECAGVHSLAQLRDLGVDVIVDQICNGVGSYAWRNRKRALIRALAAVSDPPLVFSD